MPIAAYPAPGDVEGEEEVAAVAGLVRRHRPLEAETVVLGDQHLDAARAGRAPVEAQDATAPARNGQLAHAVAQAPPAQHGRALLGRSPEVVTGAHATPPQPQLPQPRQRDDGGLAVARDDRREGVGSHRPDAIRVAGERKQERVPVGEAETGHELCAPPRLPALGRAEPSRSEQGADAVELTAVARREGGGGLLGPRPRQRRRAGRRPLAQRAGARLRRLRDRGPLGPRVAVRVVRARDPRGDGETEREPQRDAARPASQRSR